MAPSGSFYEDLPSPLLADSMTGVIMVYSVLMLCSSGLKSSIGSIFRKAWLCSEREREIETERVVCDDVMKEGVARLVQLGHFGVSDCFL